LRSRDLPSRTAHPAEPDRLAGTHAGPPARRNWILARSARVNAPPSCRAGDMDL